jgi:NSS family neurotransmitter:Na+ symporter
VALSADCRRHAFLIPWIIFLFVWSIPLLVAEFAIGRGTRRGVVGAFATLTKGRFAWMGGFVAVVTVMILFYYSVDAAVPARGILRGIP